MSDINITERLMQQRDDGYRLLQCKLTPTVAPDSVIGVRTPLLRAFARELRGTAEGERFLRELPHKYFDENNLHSAILCELRDYAQAVRAVDEFLPFVDNWATCDMLSPKAFGKNRAELLEKIPEWLSDGKTYTVRFGLEMLMSFFLDSDFSDRILPLAASVHSDEYYVSMMQAWFFATALAKQYDAAVLYLQRGELDVATHNRTIRKACESFRITDEQKQYLRTLKRQA